MQEKSRILIFTTTFRPMIGGSEIALEEIIRRLPGVFFNIVTSRYRKEFKLLESGSNFSIHRVGPGTKISKIIFPLLGFLKAKSLMRNNNYDVMHVYQASYGGGAAWLLKSFYPKLPLILTLQEGKDLAKQNILIRFFRDLIIKKADVITGISNHLIRYARKINPKAEVIIIPNGVDLNKFKIKNEKLKITDPNDKVLITVSRLVEKNGVGDLIEAFHIFNTSYKLQATSCKLLIVGDGPLEESLKFKVKSLNLESEVLFVGETSTEKIPGYLAQADVFIRPSLSEGLGTAFLEAMAAGLPIIGTPVGGIPDFLKNRVTGLFCKSGDPEDIANKINLVLSDNGLRDRLILNGRKLVEEKYTWDKIAAKFSELYSCG